MSNSLYQRAALKCDEPARCRCPVCGGLECQCRPRFFAGQLLSDEDLNRLDRYIVAKNKLHNRYLHGWGVVCGLEVACDPCPGFVTVKSGYALGPCGDDIIVCEDTRVDVCELVNACCERPHDECEPPRPVRGDECKDAVEDWVLAIKYIERPTRGVMPVKGSTAPPYRSRCGCGGSSSCGCGGNATALAAPAATAGIAGGQARRMRTGLDVRTKVAVCEPTVTCEGCTFEVYKAPPRDPRENQPGEIVRRLCCCIAGLFEAEPQLPANTADLRQWCCQLKLNWRDFFSANMTYDCTTLDPLAELKCPDPGPDQTPAEYRLQILLLLAPVLGDFIRSCICSVLLPPCPGPVGYDRVPLATVTIRREDCTILRVCNLGPRKFVTTFPNLQYWLSWLPFVPQLRKALEKACCDPLPQLREGEFAVGTNEANVVCGTGAIRRENNGVRDFARIVLRAAARPAGSVDPQVLFLGAMGVNDASGGPLMSDEELRDPLAFMLMNQVVAPLAKSVIPPGLAGPFAAAASDLAAAAAAMPADRDETIRALEAELAELQRTLRAQQATLDELIDRLGHG